MPARSYLTLLLLLNYLLVVGAGLVERPARVADRPFAYVHSHDCQLKHTLRLACFDDCNGTQYTLEKPGHKPPLHQLLTTLKGLDAHCLPVLPTLLARPVFGLAAVGRPAAAPAVPAGFEGTVYSPPRWG